MYTVTVHKNIHIYHKYIHAYIFICFCTYIPMHTHFICALQIHTLACTPVYMHIKTTVTKARKDVENVFFVVVCFVLLMNPAL